MIDVVGDVFVLIYCATNVRVLQTINTSLLSRYQMHYFKKYAKSQSRFVSRQDLAKENLKKK